VAGIQARLERHGRLQPAMGSPDKRPQSAPTRNAAPAPAATGGRGRSSAQ
jgi:hypothetical protein